MLARKSWKFLGAWFYAGYSSGSERIGITIAFFVIAMYQSPTPQSSPRSFPGSGGENSESLSHRADSQSQGTELPLCSGEE
jgi:hypothetical protein